MVFSLGGSPHNFIGWTLTWDFWWRSSNLVNSPFRERKQTQQKSKTVSSLKKGYWIHLMGMLLETKCVVHKISHCTCWAPRVNFIVVRFGQHFQLFPACCSVLGSVIESFAQSPHNTSRALVQLTLLWRHGNPWPGIVTLEREDTDLEIIEFGTELAEMSCVHWTSSVQKQSVSGGHWVCGEVCPHHGSVCCQSDRRKEAGSFEELHWCFQAGAVFALCQQTIGLSSTITYLLACDCSLFQSV